MMGDIPVSILLGCSVRSSNQLVFKQIGRMLREENVYHFRVEPSRGCGPFRVYVQIIDIMSVTVGNWPGWINDLLSYMTSGLFLFVIITILV